MYLKTGEEYIQDMIDMNFELYIDGGKISGKLSITLRSDR